jgi:hypothetical protein
MKGRPARKGKQAGAMAAVCALVTSGRRNRRAARRATWLRKLDFSRGPRKQRQRTVFFYREPRDDQIMRASRSGIRLPLDSLRMFVAISSAHVEHRETGERPSKRSLRDYEPRGTSPFECRTPRFVSVPNFFQAEPSRAARGYKLGAGRC